MIVHHSSLARRDLSNVLFLFWVCVFRPEIFSAGVHGGYGNKVDVFSAGVTLYVMLCGYEPFYGESDAELVAANKEAKLEFPESDWNQGKRTSDTLFWSMILPFKC